MKRYVCLLLSIGLLCSILTGCGKGKEPDLIELPEKYEAFVIGDKGFYIDTETIVEQPDIACDGVFQFIDRMYYVGVNDVTTVILGHLAEDVYDDLMETQNTTLTFFKRAYGISIAGTAYPTDGIIEDESEQGELGYHIKLLPDDMCILAYVYNSPSDNLDKLYFNEVDNTVFDMVYAGLPDGYTSTISLEEAIQFDIVSHMSVDDLASNIIEYGAVYNTDGTLCMLYRTYDGYVMENNVDDRFELSESGQIIYDSVTGKGYEVYWQVNPNKEEPAPEEVQEGETFDTN